MKPWRIALLCAMALSGCGGALDPLTAVPACRDWASGVEACITKAPLGYRPALEAALQRARAAASRPPDSADFEVTCQLAAHDLARTAASICPGVSFGSP